MAMGKVWRCGSFSIHRYDDLFYQIYFGTQETVDFVLTNGPWNFDNHLMLVRPRASAPPSFHKELDIEYFWVLLTGLPRYCYTMELGLKLAHLLESCQTMQLREDRVLSTKFFHFRVLVHITKPLKRVLSVTTPDGTMHVGLLKYECLPTFCFYYGFLGHRYRNCEKVPDAQMDVNSLLYGPWMGGVDHVASDQLYSMDRATMGIKYTIVEPGSSADVPVSDTSLWVDSILSATSDIDSTTKSTSPSNCSPHLTPLKRLTVSVLTQGVSTPKKKKSSTVEVVGNPANHNELSQLELPGFRVTPCNSRTQGLN